jgi:hypothetical protein
MVIFYLLQYFIYTVTNYLIYSYNITNQKTTIMKKSVLLLLLVVGLTSITTITNAQNGRFSLGVDLGIPMGTFGDYYDLGFGTTVRYEYPIGDNIGIGLTTGFLAFGGTSIETTYGTSDVSGLVMVPIQPYFRYYFMEQQDGFYGQANIGLTYSASASSTDLSTGEDVTNTSTDLSYGPEVGYALEHWDFGLRYQMISGGETVNSDGTVSSSTNSFLGLRIAFVFGSRD